MKKLSETELFALARLRHDCKGMVEGLNLIEEKGMVIQGSKFFERVERNLKLLQVEIAQAQEILEFVDKDKPTDQDFRYTLISNGHVIYYRSNNYHEVVDSGRLLLREPGWMLLLDEYAGEVVAYSGSEMEGFLHT